MARDIAQILGATVKRDGYFENDEYKVTWTYGHLCTLKEPADYTDLWKRWSLSALPMIPQRFGIKVIEQESIKRQFNVIESLIQQADEVINCGDAGQEGELIQRWVMQKAKTGCKVMRLWISSLTDESIREGFKTLKPQEDFDNLYYAGRSRAVGGWILGINATRLYSLKYSEPGKVLSIGRVQTPTLAIVVQRELEIANFKPEDYWEIKTLYRNVTFNSSAGRYKSEADALEAMELISGKELYITDVQDKKGREAAPRLFDLTSLQVECNKRWGWTADETLKLIQSLYEKKVTTYPRVDTTYLTDDIYAKVPDILRRMTPYANLTTPILGQKLPKSKKVFDNSKVTDHHAIIPTGQSPSVLDGNEKKMYHLIARRFIAVFYPDCIFSTTTVNATVDTVAFKATGKTILEPGWREIYATDKDKAESGEQGSEEPVLPPFEIGEHGLHEPSLLKKATQPPKYYTEGTLLRAMESAGKMVDDEELLELVEMEITEILEEYEFTDCPIIKGSALKALEDPKGEWGDKVMELMAAVDEHIPDPQRATDQPFLMPIEDIFTITGRGTVATGRVERGVLHVNEEVEIVGIKEETKKTVVTGIEMFRKLLDEAQAGDNIGALLRGVQRTEIERGQVLAKPGSVTCHTKFTAQVYVLTKDEGGRHTPFFNNYRPQFYFRTTDVTGVISLPAGTEMCMPGDNVEMTIELITPVAMDQGVKFSIREGGRTVGAGSVVEVIE